jgi:hypothetical protein
LSSEVESSSLFPTSLIVTGTRDSVAGGYCVRCLKFAAMVSVKVYEERFIRLKEVDPGKDKVTAPWFADVRNYCFAVGIDGGSRLSVWVGDCH